MKLTPYNRDDLGKCCKNSFGKHDLNWHLRGIYHWHRMNIVGTRLTL